MLNEVCALGPWLLFTLLLSTFRCVFGNSLMARTKPREISPLTVLVMFLWFPGDNIV